MAVSPHVSLSCRARALFVPWLLRGGRACSGGAAAAHTPATAHTSAAGVAASAADAQGGAAFVAADAQMGPLEGADAELLEVVAVQVLPFLVRAHVLARALQPHGQPDDGLLQAYASLHHHQQQPPQQQQPRQLESAHCLADQLCASMGVGGLGLALSRGLTAVGAPPARLSTSAPEVPLDRELSTVRLHRWCGHLPWALHACSQPEPSAAPPPPQPPAPLPLVPTAAMLSGQQAMGSTSSSSCSSRRCPLPGPPSLIALPPLFQDLLLFFAGKVCTHCKQQPDHPFLCLATGQLLCSWWTGCVKGRGGGTLHAAEACSGSTLMLSLKSTKVVALRGPRTIVVQSPYLDAHGEEDPELRRGRPLYLQPSIYAHLSKLWSSAALDYDSVLLHSSRSDLDLL
uniref:E3 ubiquitin-protein ligase n=1 Tax=Dunaliella tertiolecta TaxID=3047 RepID=A0A7S3VRI3_DUNTE